MRRALVTGLLVGPLSRRLDDRLLQAQLIRFVHVLFGTLTKSKVKVTLC
jgi:hypothetical protein